MNRNTSVGAAILVVALAGVARGALVNVVDSFPGTSTNFWTGGTPLSNPGSGGVDGTTDGYLRLSSTFFGHVGTNNQHFASPYRGDWIAAGVQVISFYLNDVGANDSWSIHVAISNGGSSATTWQYDAGFDPPNNSWEQYMVPVTSSAGWTRTRGTDSFEDVLRSVDRLLFRHDTPPFVEFPTSTFGDVGIDNIVLLVPEPGALAALALVGVLGLRRQGR